MDSGSGESTVSQEDPLTPLQTLGANGWRAVGEHEARPRLLAPVGWWRCHWQAQGGGQGPGCGGRVGQAMSGSVTKALTQLLSLPFLSTLHCLCGWRGPGTQI